MLRRNNRMPGPVYEGNYLNNKWLEKDFPKLGDLDIHDEFNPLGMMINYLYSSKISEHNKFWEFLNKEKFANWMAFMTLSGGIHSDVYHNQLFYFDPSLGKIEPVINDPLSLGTLLYPGAKDRLKKYKPDHKLPINERITPITAKALKDPFYTVKKRKIYKLLNGTMSYENQKKKLDKIYNSIESTVLSDSKKSFVMEMFVGFFRYPLSNKRFSKEKENIYQWIKLRNQYLLKKLQESTVEISYKKFKNNKIRLLVSIDGHSSIQFDVSKFKNQNIKAFFNLDENAQTIVVEKLELYPGLKKNNDYYYEQTKDSRMPKYYLFPDNQYYLFELDSIDLKNFKKKLKNSFKNVLTKKKINSKYC